MTEHPWTSPCVLFAPDQEKQEEEVQWLLLSPKRAARAEAAASTVSTRPRFTSETPNVDTKVVQLFWFFRDCSRLFSAISNWRFGGLRFQVCQEVSFWSTELQDGVDKCLVGSLALVTLGPREGAVSYSGTVPGLVGKGTPIWCLVPCLLRPPGRETLTFATFLPSFCQIKWFMPSDSELSVPGSNCWAFVDWTWTVWGRRSSDSSPWISKRRHLRHTTFYA